MLHLYLNCIKVIPPEIKNLTSLTMLGLNENQITVLPPGLYLYFFPFFLFFSFLSFSLLLFSFPSLLEIGLLSNLRILDLRYNKLTVLPSEICQLVQLRKLFLRFPPLHPFSLSYRCPLFTNPLFPRYNKLHALPPEIVNLEYLELLSIRNNSLSTLPAQMSRLKNLRVCF